MSELDTRIDLLRLLFFKESTENLSKYTVYPRIQGYLRLKTPEIPKFLTISRISYFFGRIADNILLDLVAKLPYIPIKAKSEDFFRLSKCSDDLITAVCKRDKVNQPKLVRLLKEPNIECLDCLTEESLISLSKQSISKKLGLELIDRVTCFDLVGLNLMIYSRIAVEDLRFSLRFKTTISSGKFNEDSPSETLNLLAKTLNSEENTKISLAKETAKLLKIQFQPEIVHFLLLKAYFLPLISIKALSFSKSRATRIELQSSNFHPKLRPTFKNSKSAILLPSSKETEIFIGKAKFLNLPLNQ